jgi:hypothetical protein
METDAHNEADTILLALRRAPKDREWQQMPVEERAEIMVARDRLLDVKQSDDPIAIRESIVALDWQRVDMQN